MDCTLIIPTAITKFSHSALSILLSTQLGLSGPVPLSCDWTEDGNIGDPPIECLAHLPEGSTCDEIPENLFDLYDPAENDKEEMDRMAEEAKRDEPLIQELLAEIAALKAKDTAIEAELATKETKSP